MTFLEVMKKVAMTNKNSRNSLDVIPAQAGTQVIERTESIKLDCPVESYDSPRVDE